MIKQVSLRLFYLLYFAQGYYRNSQHKNTNFIVAFDQSDSLTQPCPVRIYTKQKLEYLLIWLSSVKLVQFCTPNKEVKVTTKINVFVNFHMQVVQIWAADFK